MPHVAITIRKGRSSDQIRALAAEVTDAVVTTLGVTPDRVRLVVHELDGERIAQGGTLVADAERPTLKEDR
jgi:4-oxalocrotonate tautomerase family enzyme